MTEHEHRPVVLVGSVDSPVFLCAVCEETLDITAEQWQAYWKRLLGLG